MPGLAAPRVRYREIKPYETVGSLAELAGPDCGPVTLPSWILWIPDAPSFDVASDDEAPTIYQAVLAEGTSDDMRFYLNRDRLEHLWRHLHLDPRIRQLWESQHPQLSELS